MPGTIVMGIGVEAPEAPAAEGRSTLQGETERKSDNALMAEFRGGSREAFEALFERYKQPLYGFFRRRVGLRESAEELTQETFLGLFRARSRYEERAMFRTYLYAIAMNVLRAHRRKAESRGIFLNAEGEEPVSQSSPHASVVLREALALLNEMEREVLLLREFEQMSYAEIAKLLAIPLNTVRSRLLRARLAFRGVLTAGTERGGVTHDKERV